MKLAMRLVMFVVLISIIVGCGGTATVKLELAKASSSAIANVPGVRGAVTGPPTGATIPTPTTFQMKIVQAYLVEDVDANSNNVGAVSRVWLHADCGGNADTCTDDKISYFDLTDPTAANEKLKSEALAFSLEKSSVTYQYVRLEFCVGGAKGNNVKFKTADMAAEKEVTYGGCGETSAKLDPPVVATNGTTVTVKLNYNFKNGPVYYTTNGGSCTQASPCISGIELSPTLVQ
jgi:hypothetical protein